MFAFALPNLPHLVRKPPSRSTPICIQKPHLPPPRPAAPPSSTTALESSQPPHTYAAFHNLLSNAVSNNDWRAALRAFTALEKSGFYSSKATTSLLLKSLSQSDRFSEIKHVLSQLSDPSITLADGSVHTLHPPDQARRAPDEKIILRVANSAIDASQPQLACNIISHMEDRGLKPSVFTTSVLIKAYGRMKHSHAVHALLRRLDKYRIKPDLIVLNGAIDAYMRCGERALATEVLAQISKRGLVPNSRSFNPILRSLAQAGKLQEALAVRQDMERRAVVPSLHSYNALIHAAVRSKAWGIAARFLTEAIQLAERQSLDSPHPHESLASYRDLCVGFTSVISGVALEGKLDDAITLLKSMVHRIEKANLQHQLQQQVGIAVTAILSALLRKGDVINAWSIFRSITTQFQFALPPDTYNAVIRGLTRCADPAALDAAATVFEEMLRVFASDDGTPRVLPSNNKGPSVVAKVDDFVRAYNCIMDGHVRCGDTSTAEALLDDMEASGISATAVSYTTLINGYGMELDLKSAKRIFKRMRQTGISPDKIAMNAFIGACIRADDLELALRIFDEMQKVGGRLSPNLTTFSAIIAGHVRSGHSTLAWDAYEEMKAMGIVPNERLLDRMMAAFVSPDLKPSREEAAIDIDDGDEMGEIVEQVDVHTDLIHEGPFIGELSADGWSSKRALQLLKDMEQCKCSEVNKRRWRRAVKSLWGT